MRVLICGSRTYDDPEFVASVLLGMFMHHDIGFLLTHVEHFTVIAGEAPGADTFAKEWAIGGGTHPYNLGEIPALDTCSVYYEGYSADWDQYGKAAGPIRNKQMLVEGKPDCVVAFIDKPLKDSKGTLNMVTQAMDAGLPVTIIGKV